ncbi:hypothetical protein [Legionella sp. W05-934-2]|jgi:hypothetical protein|uniref:hypothetical protein n=1 Tax=Legionella sp. W05-934-2 TaxID=1198649 RepID=UPI003461F100
MTKGRFAFKLYKDMTKSKFPPMQGLFTHLTAPPPTAHFRMGALNSFAKRGLFAALVGCTGLYMWDQFQQHKSRQILDSATIPGKVTFSHTTAVESKDLNISDYNEGTPLSSIYGKGAQVYVGGGRKEGFRGIVPLPKALQPSDDVRTTPLSNESVAHVGITVAPVDKGQKPIIVGRQSPLGPMPTLYAAIQAAWNQYTNPVPGETVQSAWNKAMKTTVANEVPHIAKGTSFDTMVIEDMAIPVEFVDDALKKAEQNLNPVMNFAFDNCMTTKSYVLLQLAKRVDQWAESGEKGAPSREQANSFMKGVQEIIKADVHTRGYGVLNNPVITRELEDFSGITARRSQDMRQEEENKPSPDL